MKTRSIVSLSAMLLASAGVVSASVFVKDPVPLVGQGGGGYAAGSLVDTEPASAEIVGFNGKWLSGNTSVLQVNETGLEYPLNVPLTASGGSFAIYNTTASSTETTGRALSRSINASELPSNGELYFSVLLKMEAAAMAQLRSDYAYYIGVNRVGYNAGSHNSETAKFPSSGVYVGFYNNSGTVTVSLSANGVKQTLVPAAVAGETYFCVVKVALNAGSDNKEIVSAVVNPTGPSISGEYSASVEAAVLNTGETFTYVTVGGYYPTNSGYVFFDEFMMADSNFEVCPILSDGAAATPAGVSDIGLHSATINGQVIIFGSSTADVFLDVAPDAEEFSGAGEILGSFAASAPVSSAVGQLMPDTAYKFRFRAEWMTGAATSSVLSFRTLGAVSFGSLSGSNVLSTAFMSGSVSHFGVAPTTVTLWFGESADDLRLVETWSGVAQDAEFSKTVADCGEAGKFYYYAFKAEYTFGGVAHEYMSEVKTIYFPSDAIAFDVLYWGGGSADIEAGTPLPSTSAELAGTWDKTTRNWSIDAAGSAYVAWNDGANVAAHFPPFPAAGTATVTMMEDVRLNKLIVPHNYPNSPGWNHQYTLTAGEPRTVALDGWKPEILAASGDYTRILQFNPNVTLVAPDGFAKTAIGNLIFASDSSQVGGLVTATGSAGRGIEIASAGALVGVREFLVNSDATLSVNLTAGANDKINDNAVVRLSGKGAFNPKGAVKNATETFRLLELDAAGVLNLSSGVGEVFITEGLSRGKDGTGTLIVDNSASAVTFGGDSTPTDTLLPWAYTPNAQPAQLDSATRRFKSVAVTPAPADLSTWTNNARYHISGSYTPVNTLTDTAIDSLGIRNDNGAFTINIAPGNTLDIKSGQLALTQGSGDAARIIKGGRLTSSSGELYMMTHGSANLSLSIESEITGAIDLIKSGFFTVNLSGTNANTYTGTTYANGGRLALLGSKPFAIPGDIVINRGGTVYLDGCSNTDKINPAAQILIREGGTLHHNDSANQLYNGPIEVENGSITVRGPGAIEFRTPGYGLVFKNGGTMPHTRTEYTAALRLLTDVRCEAASSNQTVISTVMRVPYIGNGQDNDPQRLSLSFDAAATRTYDIADAIGLPPELPEMVIDMPLATADGREVELVKTGSGALALEQLSGRFRGTVSVLDGALLLNGAYATQTVLQASPRATNRRHIDDLASTAQLFLTQPIGGENVAQSGIWIERIYDDHSIRLSAAPWNDSAEKAITFLACGAVGRAPVTVSATGVLGGSGGSGGSVYLEGAGALSPGAPARPIATFRIGGDLDFSAGGKWVVDIADADTCDIVEIDGDITLGGALEPKLADGFNPPTGEWIIATYNGDASGRMSAPEGYRVIASAADQTIRMRKSNFSTMLIIR